MGETKQYIAELRFSMTVACLVFAIPIALSLAQGAWISAVCGWLVAEAHFWLCSVTPTEQWLAERQKNGNTDA